MGAPHTFLGISPPPCYIANNSVHPQLSTLSHPGPVPYLPNPAEALRRHPRALRRAISSVSLYGPGEAEGDAVGEGDGEAVGDADGVPVVAGPEEGTGVVVGVVRSGRAGGSY
jgi:hypothetical protein